MTALYITIVIVAGFVIVGLAIIAWLWALTTKLGSLPFGRRDDQMARRLDELDQRVQSLQREVDALKNR